MKIIILIFSAYMTVMVQGAVDADYLEKRVDDILIPVCEANYWSGVVLLNRKGQIVHKTYGFADKEENQPITTHTRFPLGRASSPFTAIAVLKCVEFKKINLTDPLSLYLPEYPNGDKITIHHLMAITSGIPDLVQFASDEDFFRIRSEFTPIANIINLFKNEPLMFEPGSILENHPYKQNLSKTTEFGFTNISYLLLTQVIEKITNDAYELFVQKNILDPLGMKNTGFFTNNNPVKNLALPYKRSTDKLVRVKNPYLSNFRGTQSMYTTAEDMFKLFKSFHTEDLLPRQLLDVMLSPYSGDRVGHRFCYGWAWIQNSETGNRIIYTSSDDEGHKVNLIHQPEQGLTLIMLSNIGNLSPRMVPSKSKHAKPLPSRPFLQALVRLMEAPEGESIAWHIEKNLDKYGIDDALNRGEAMIERGTSCYLKESEINTLGYKYLAMKKEEEALKVFKFNIEHFPESWNVYDSMAEAIFNSGDKTQAIALFKKSLELNPANQNAIQFLEQIDNK